MVLETFSSLTQSQEDLLSKKYCFGSLGLLRVSSAAANIQFKAKAAATADAAVSTSTSVEVKSGKVVCRPKIFSKGQRTFRLEFAASKKLKIKGEVIGLADQSHKASCSAEYSDKHLRAKLAICGPSVLRLTTTFGKKRQGVAIDSQLDLSKSRFLSYNFLKYWVKKNYQIVLKHQSLNQNEYQWGDFSLSYYGKTSEKTEVAAKAVVNWPGKETFLEFGGVYKYAEDVQLRGMLNSLGRISAGLTKSFSDSLQLSLATQIDATKAAQIAISDYRLGVRIDLNL